MSRFLFVDGHNLLFQMFFGMPSRIVNSDGVAIQGVVGFVGALNKMIDLVRPTHVAVIFDSEQTSDRREIDECYKANRPDYSEVADSENPFSQLGYIYAALDFMGVKYAEAVGEETDDVIASYVLNLDGSDEAVIASFDSDYFQLVKKNVSVLRYRGKASVVLKEEDITAKFGVLPKFYADAKSLFGDNSDNLRGVKGIGLKTAAKLVSEYGSVADAKAFVGKIENEKLYRTVSENLETVERNYRLIKLDAHAKVPFSTDELAFSSKEVKTMDIVRAIGL